MNECIGIRSYDFQPENSKDKLAGYTLWFAETPDGAHGIIPFKVSLSNAKFSEIFGRMKPQELVGCKFNLFFNRLGRLASADLAE